MRKHYCNFNYFEKIDTEDKAYFLGFLYADGCISLKTVNAGSMILSVLEKDKYILEIFKTKIESTKPLVSSNTKGKIRKIKNTLWVSNDNQIIMSIHSGKLCKDLINLGCLERKTQKLEFPNFDIVPKNLIHHFIRGYFDGDGTISCGIDKRGIKYASMGILGTESMMIGIQNIFIQYCNMNKTKLYYRNNVVNLPYSGVKSLLKVREFLYKDATIYLTRKKEKFYKL